MIKRVLIACEFSAKVRNAFRSRGFEAVSCDLLPSDDPQGLHIQGDVLDVLDRGWDLMIAHPPCKYLCAAGNAFLNKRPELAWRANRALGAEFFMKLMDAPIPMIAVENPVGCMNSGFRKPDQIIRPWMFGHPYSKDICLWLKGLPLLNSGEVLKPPYKRFDFWSTKRVVDGRSLKSITFDGVAEAMASQWGKCLD